MLRLLRKQKAAMPRAAAAERQELRRVGSCECKTSLLESLISSVSSSLYSKIDMVFVTLEKSVKRLE